jgi:hypothetical protein
VIELAPVGAGAATGGGTASATATAKPATKRRAQEAPTVLGAPAHSPRAVPHILPVQQVQTAARGRSLWREGFLLLILALGAALAGYYLF